MEINKLIRSSRRSVSIEVTEQGKLVVRAPKRLSQKAIQEVLQQHSQWINRKRREIEARPKPQRHSFLEGEVFYYQGKPCRLRFTSPESAVRVEDGCMMVPRLDSIQQMGSELVRWYRQKAKDILLPRVKELADQFGFEYTGAKITGAKTRWGSCSGKNSICLSWYLIMAPEAVSDSVIIHELCHTIYHNHSHAFWSLCSQRMPDYPIHRQWLKENRHLLRMDFAEDGISEG